MFEIRKLLSFVYMMKWINPFQKLLVFQKENMPAHGDLAADHVANNPQSTGGVADQLNEFGNIAT